jgi:nitroreductase
VGPVGRTDFFAVVHAQRACREFAATPVTDADLATVLDAAVHAPSAENRQPWEFVVVRDPTTRGAIAALMERAWTARGRDFSRDRLSPELLTAVDRGMTGGFASAPVLIVVAADTERGLAAAAAESVYPAVQNLLLAATAIGLGSALTTIALGSADELRDLVGFPGHLRPMAVVPLGHPARPLGPPRRAPYPSRTHRERYGEPWGDDQGTATVGSA